ncbi:cell wall organization protein [Schizosaccharomyces japonicus yFS275]|uniref:Cell wall organization protein n=1 Tax=Schizosaccharomyces japonicus (strain yFS275 / FY16936) TaxID=402676 RepID=B6K067_SCHJY|nr:cell wall organization protein [Schizosaccharomyces japonicus yFS275]EEB06217.1 cell wall organization protein [Schizosaccharomyces japonicus yFS275]
MQSSSSSDDSYDTEVPNWYIYGRWVLFVCIIVAAIFTIVSISFINRKRARSGRPNLPFTNFYPLSQPPPYTPSADMNTPIRNAEPAPPQFSSTGEVYYSPTVPGENPPPAYPKAVAYP